ncbi:hypothetical protein ACFV97_02625 [Streptomyces sp. NPDC059913]|uniref:hypothetical protein n=1 Tax=unclassified Streptomyces TaxID=2593676 RepID=UPI0036658061
MSAPMTPETGNEPLIVRRFDTAMEPAPEEEQILTIGCIAEGGRPVALLLDLDDRPKVAGWLAMEPGGSMHTALTGAYLDAWEEQRENARLRLALESARRGRRELRARVSRLKFTAALAEEDYRRVVRGASLIESQLRARVAELEALAPAPIQTCRVCGAGYTLGQPCAVCEFKKHVAAAAPAEKDTPKGESTSPEALSPWEQAVAGLNALVDADVIFHVEPDGHISAPFSDEHIEWDLKARRWVLTHDDEDDRITPDSTPDQPMTADEWNARYPVGTPVLAYPGTRDDEPLDTVTRSRAWTLGHGAAVVSVEGEAGGIHLTHVDPVDGAS